MGPAASRRWMSRDALVWGLVGLGLLLFVAAIVNVVVAESRGLPFLVAGSLCFVVGVAAGLAGMRR